MSFVCSRCGKTHDGLAAWVYARPDPWLGLTDEQRADGKCSDDLCRTADGHFFVRSVLVLPLIGGPEPTFEFGVWGSLSEANFWRYVECFDDTDQSKLGLMFSYLSNEVRGFPDSFALHANLQPRDDRQRPFMLLEPTDHPLAVAQRDGIVFEKVLEITHVD
ncbi:MAG: DUF2199 domain-containing protein [Caulobacter sp.]|nr:DUF2199 domain-containing protein [Caulobacter sp.]